MKKLVAGLLLSAIMPIFTLAQNVKVTNASERRWSGGRAGYGGSNTDIAIKSVYAIQIDSLYLKGQNMIWGYCLSSPCSGGWNLRKDNAHHYYYLSQSSTYTPHLMNNNYDPDDPDNNVKLKKAKVQDSVPVIKCNNIIPAGTGRQFVGAALVTYFYKGKKQFVIVKEIKQLPSISYP